MRASSASVPVASRQPDSRASVNVSPAAVARHRGRLARKDAPVAITATARELACLIYTLITRGEEYVERGIEAHEQRRVDRTVSNLGRRAKQLGYQLVRMPEDTDETPGAQSMA